MGQEVQRVSNVSASSSAFTLHGGLYLMSVVATFGGGSVKLQALGPDGSTYLDIQAPFNNAGTEADLVIGTFAAAGAKLLYLPSGQYRFTIATATAVYAAITSVPLSSS